MEEYREILKKFLYNLLEQLLLLIIIIFIFVGIYIPIRNTAKQINGNREIIDQMRKNNYEVEIKDKK
ncbi:MAG: hypothetical protein GX308_00630 [Epulopiscium sp.]|nr:hypothetical protein [Candidatus Epulonipiscium sp.]